jgi:hypothetical protein
VPCRLPPGPTTTCHSPRTDGSCLPPTRRGRRPAIAVASPMCAPRVTGGAGSASARTAHSLPFFFLLHLSRRRKARPVLLAGRLFFSLHEKNERNPRAQRVRGAAADRARTVCGSGRWAVVGAVDHQSRPTHGAVGGGTGASRLHVPRAAPVIPGSAEAQARARRDIRSPGGGSYLSQSP